MNEQERKDFELVDNLEDKIRKNYITTIDELMEECKKINEQVGYDLVDESILSDMEWNCCDLCGALYPSDELCWTEYLDPEYDQDLINDINLRGEDICAVCYECVKQIRKEKK